MSHQKQAEAEKELRHYQHMETNQECAVEWSRFSSAIKEARPAIHTFSSEALMFLYLTLGAKSLREERNELVRTVP